jgi:hypothetical protein
VLIEGFSQGELLSWSKTLIYIRWDDVSFIIRTGKVLGYLLREYKFGFPFWAASHIWKWWCFISIFTLTLPQSLIIWKLKSSQISPHQKEVVLPHPMSVLFVCLHFHSRNCLRNTEWDKLSECLQVWNLFCPYVCIIILFGIKFKLKIAFQKVEDIFSNFFIQFCLWKIWCLSDSCSFWLCCSFFSWMLLDSSVNLWGYKKCWKFVYNRIFLNYLILNLPDHCNQKTHAFISYRKLLNYFIIFISLLSKTHIYCLMRIWNSFNICGFFLDKL